MTKISKKSKRRLSLLVVVFVGLIGALVSTIFGDMKSVMASSRETKELETLYQSLLEAEESLESEVIKLQDPEYVARYAREKYLYSKDGETIIRLP